MDRSPLWITYLGNASSNLPTAIDFGPDGLIHVTGFTNDASFPHATGIGMYTQPDVFESWFGSFYTRFKTNQELLHSTWFGGDAGNTVTWARALAATLDGVLITGSNAKASSPLAYFPLDDGYGVPWFDGEFNHLGQSALGTDGFVTLFCQELGVGLEVQGTDPASPELTVVASSSDRIALLGLPDGQHPYYIANADGRVVTQGRFASFGGRSSNIPIGELPTGLYLLRCTNGSTVRFLIP